MKAVIITIGDEILNGQITDTNSQFIAENLTAIGVSVVQIISIQDTEKAIVSALTLAENIADVILLTGGLGPTRDDVTKQSICKYFNDVLVEDSDVLKQVSAVLRKEVSSLLLVNKQQALVPSTALVLPNKNGTAPGMCFSRTQKMFFVLPGVPLEMKALLTDFVLPKIQKEAKLPFIYQKIILTQGIGESALADLISDWETTLPPQVKLAYLPSFGLVRLRLSAKGTHKKEIITLVEDALAQVLPKLKAFIVGGDNDTPATTVIKLLQSLQKTIAVAESCTGGLIASEMTQHKGVSAVFKGGVTVYQTQTKSDILGVDASLIEKHSVVSEPVAAEMAKKVQQKFNSDYAIATTGNAGPTKGDSGVAVGTVCVAIATKLEIKTYTFNFGSPRNKVIHRAKNQAFYLLRKEILSLNS